MLEHKFEVRETLSTGESAAACLILNQRKDTPGMTLNYTQFGEEYFSSLVMYRFAIDQT